MRTLRKPTLKSGKNLLEESLRENQIAVVIGSCVVNYRGRASSVLPEGERVVIIKPDGTILVHQKEKREPVNWNPPGCRAEVKLGEEDLQLISKRAEPEETLLILFKNLKLVTSFELVDEEELQLMGTEEDLVKYALQNPSLIEEGFKPEEREKSIGSGVIDLYGEDPQGRKIAIEFKRSKATLSAVGQLGRYVKELEEKIEKEVRGLIVAPQITSGASKLLSKENLEYVRIGEPPTSEFEELTYDKNQKQIKEFSKKCEENSE